MVAGDLPELVTIVVKAAGDARAFQSSNNVISNDSTSSNSSNSSNNNAESSKKRGQASRSSNGTSGVGHETSGEGRAEVPRAWLKSAYFEAKLERWLDQNAPPSIVLEIPGDCDAREGASLLAARLKSASEKSSGGEAKGPGATCWSSLDWWKATKGSMAAFSAALHIFHLTMLDYTKEVVQALAFYRLQCPPAVVAIAAELKVTLHQIQEPQPALKVDLAMLCKAVDNVCKSTFEHESTGWRCNNCQKCTALKVLAGRLLAGSPPSRPVMKVLIAAWLDCFVLQVTRTDWPASAARLGGCASIGHEKACSPRSWLEQQIEHLVRREHNSLVDLNAEFHARLPIKETEVTMRYLNKQGRGTERQEKVQLVNSFRVAVANLYNGCLTIALAESGRRPEVSDAVSAMLRKLDLQFRFIQSEGVHCVSPSVDILGAGSVPVQLTLLEVLPEPSFKVFQNRVSSMHEEVRHCFIPRAFQLSQEDMNFLATASFPGLEQSEAREGQEEAKRKPAAKRARNA